MSIPTLFTPRLKLRPLGLEDLDALHEILQEPGILNYFPNPDPPSIEKVEKVIAQQLDQYENYALGTWAVELRQDPKLIGWCGLNHLPETNEDEVAYLLTHAVHGRGLATEATKLSLDYGFQRLDLERIIALMHPDNVASKRVAEKIGMTFLDRKTYWGLELLRYEKLNTGL